MKLGNVTLEELSPLALDCGGFLGFAIQSSDLNNQRADAIQCAALHSIGTLVAGPVAVVAGRGATELEHRGEDWANEPVLVHCDPQTKQLLKPIVHGIKRRRIVIQWN